MNGIGIPARTRGMTHHNRLLFCSLLSTFSRPCEYLLKRSHEQRISAVVLALIKNHPNLLEPVLTFSQEFHDGPERDWRRELERISECPCGDRRERDAAQLILCCNLQTATISA